VLKISRYFVVGELATTSSEVIRIAGLLRGVESAVQAVSVSFSPSFYIYIRFDDFQYGLNSISIIGSVGGTYINFGLWALALWPGWLVVREIGVSLGDRKVLREEEDNGQVIAPFA